MIIAAHIGGKAEKKSFFIASLSLLSLKYSADQFIIFSEYPIPGLNDNCIQVPIMPKPKNKLLLYYWYNYKLPSLLIKYNAGRFVSNAGMISMKTGVPQYLYFGDNKFEKGSNSFFKKIFRLSLSKAQTIFTAEDFIKDALIEKYGVSPAKTKTVYHALSGGETESSVSDSGIKIGEYDYYFCPVTSVSSVHLIIILKAFSQLKKRQKTSMKLVLMLLNIQEKNLIPDFKNYRYREDVLIISEKETSAFSVENAFGLIWFCGYEHAAIAFAALKSGVPVIVPENNINKSLFRDAAIFTALSETGLAENMQLLYKDETVRKNLNENAEILLENYDAEQSAEQLRAAIMR